MDYLVIDYLPTRLPTAPIDLTESYMWQRFVLTTTVTDTWSHLRAVKSVVA